MKTVISRREFLRSIIRYSLLSVALVMARALYGRRGVDPRQCRVVSPCRQCAVFENCNLPKAGAARLNS